MIRQTLGSNINADEGVLITTPVNNNVLTYESSTSLWKNKTVATALGYTPVPETRTLTINGTTQDLSANRTFTIATGLTVGTTPITSGTVGRVLFEGTGNVLQESANLFWDNVNKRFGVGTNAPFQRLSVVGTTTTIPNNATWISAGNPIGSFYGEGDAGNMDFFIGGASTTITSRPVLIGRKSAGTLASPTALSNGHTIFSFLSSGFSGTTFINTASINMIVDGSVSSTSVPQAITFETGASSRAERMRLSSSGNLLINTTTDAGFKLDVNGTARVQGSVICNFLSFRTDGLTSIFPTNDGFNPANNGNQLRFTSNLLSAAAYGYHFNNATGNLIWTSGTGGVVNIRTNYQPTSGTGVFNVLALTNTIYQTGGANGITRGLYIDPTLTSAANFRAIETARGNIVFGNLPTSSAGLPTGAIWNDAGTVKIV
jgi:hypothetical protein